jgi:hypothetical protein
MYNKERLPKCTAKIMRMVEGCHGANAFMLPERRFLEEGTNDEVHVFEALFNGS